MKIISYCDKKDNVFFIRWFTPKNEYKSMILNDLCSDKKGDPEIINIIKESGLRGRG